ncbi:MAG: hypothetical protein BroJett003_23460 [Planctomycetota bacterium]|nr:MAG: hypothetical protein BroJett003_23460 [Planctomycetota bacterium]
MIAGQLDRGSFDAVGLAPQLALLDGPEENPWARPLYFWIGLPPFAGIAGLLVLLGKPLEAAAAVGVYIVGATFLAPQVGLYAAFAIQAWDPYFVDPARHIEILGFPTPTKVLSLVLAAVLLATPRRRKQKITTTRLAFVLAGGFVAWTVAISALSPLPLLALRYSAQVLVLVVLGLAAVRFIRTREQVNRLMFWTIVGSLTACVLFHATGDPLSQRRGTLGEFSNPNTTAMTLSLGMIAIPAAWGLTRRKWMWALYAPAAAYIMMTLMMTGSRAACVSVVMAYSLGAVLTRGRGFVKKLAAAIFATTFGVGVFFAVLEARILDEKSQQRLEALVQSGQTTGQGFSRWYIWSNGVKTFLADPLVGAGLGNAPLAMAQVLHGEARDVHSNYLAAMVETGAVGAGLFLGVLAAAALATWRIPQANPGVPATILLLYVLLSSVTHTTYLTKMFWLPLVLALVVCEHGASAGRAGTTGSPLPTGEASR